MPSKLRLRGSSAIGRALYLLPDRPRKKLLLLVLVQLFLGCVDLVAVGLVGVLGTLAVAGVQSSQLGSSGTVGRALDVLGLAGLPVQAQVAWLASVTALVFISRTIASIYLTRRALHFLGVRSAEASADLVDRLLEQPLTFLQTRSLQDFIYAVTTSANALVLGVLGTIVVMAADSSMLVAMAFLLLWVSPLVALVAGALMAILVVILHRLTTLKAHTLGTQGAHLDVGSRELLVEAISTYRDMQVRGSRGFYADRIRDTRLAAAYVAAELTFLPNVSKYVLEAAVIVGAFVVGGLEFALEDAQRAVGVLSLFLAAGMRLAPAVIRIQQGGIALRGNLGQATHALALSAELGATESDAQHVVPVFTTAHDGFVPSVQLQGVSYRYPTAPSHAISSLTLKIEPGALVALVGPSGGGKSTTTDLMLGVLEPDEGAVSLAGVAPKAAEARWPGAVGYVPQDVWLVEGSIRRNVTLGFPESGVPDAAVWEALEAARLESFVRSLPEGLDSWVGERGARLSGGQRQRLGIARALLTRPKLLVMDEATSALDAETEHEVTKTLAELHGTVTVVVIAHRLAVVRDADVVVYIADAAVRATGRFEEVRATVPDFDHQAALLGL